MTSTYSYPPSVLYKPTVGNYYIEERKDPQWMPVKITDTMSDQGYKIDYVSLFLSPKYPLRPVTITISYTYSDYNFPSMPNDPADTGRQFVINFYLQGTVSLNQSSGPDHSMDVSLTITDINISVDGLYPITSPSLQTDLQYVANIMNKLLHSYITIRYIEPDLLPQLGIK